MRTIPTSEYKIQDVFDFNPLKWVRIPKGKTRNNKHALAIMKHKQIANRRKRRFLFGRS